MTDRTTVREALAALGSTTHDIAVYLEDKGITGALSNAEQCPISNYVRHALHRNVYVWTGQWSLRWQEIKPGSPEDFDSLILPDPVVQFVIEFDRGRFPELEQS